MNLSVLVRIMLGRDLWRNIILRLREKMIEYINNIRIKEYKCRKCGFIWASYSPVTSKDCLRCY